MNKRKIGFLFGGQGSQQIGMGHDFYQSEPTFQSVFNELDEEMRQICFNGPNEKLTDTLVTQQVMLAFGVGVASVLKEEGIEADIACGLSLGEYSALCYTESLEFKNALNVVSQRAMLMQEALRETDSTMMAVLNADITKVQEVCQSVSNGVCKIANINSPKQIVISGHRTSLNQAKELLKPARTIELAVAGAFHSCLLKDASLHLKTVLEAVEIRQPKIPIVFNASGSIENENLIDLLTKQIHNTVYFSQCVSEMVEFGVTDFIEINPKPVLQSFVHQIDKDVHCYCVSDIQSLKKVVEKLK